MQSGSRCAAQISPGLHPGYGWITDCQVLGPPSNRHKLQFVGWVERSDTHRMLGAAVVIVGDVNPVRLAHAKAVGFEARGHGHAGAQHEVPAPVLNSLMGVVRVAGKIGIPGLYVTEDPGEVDAAAKIGSLSIRFGLGWAKSHSFHTGQTPVMKYNCQLMQAIMWDRINIAEVVCATHITPLRRTPCCRWSAKAITLPAN